MVRLAGRLKGKPLALTPACARVKASAEDWEEGAEGSALAMQILSTRTDTKSEIENQAKKVSVMEGLCTKAGDGEEAPGDSLPSGASSFQFNLLELRLQPHHSAREISPPSQL